MIQCDLICYLLLLLFTLLVLSVGLVFMYFCLLHKICPLWDNKVFLNLNSRVPLTENQIEKEWKFGFISFQIVQLLKVKSIYLSIYLITFMYIYLIHLNHTELRQYNGCCNCLIFKKKNIHGKKNTLPRSAAELLFQAWKFQAWNLAHLSRKSFHMSRFQMVLDCRGKKISDLWEERDRGCERCFIVMKARSGCELVKYGCC